MKSGLRIIIIDKDEKQAETIARQLKQAKLLQSWQLVSDAKEFSLALAQKPDLIIANYYHPQLKAQQVLSLLKNKKAEIPCIVTTNNGDSESAVECLKAGAVDYISNIHLFRLPATVQEIMEKSTRSLQHQQRMEKALKLTKYAVDYSPFPLLWCNRAGAVLWANAVAQELLEYSLSEISSLTIFDISAEITPKDWQLLHDQLLRAPLRLEMRFIAKNNNDVPLQVLARSIHQNGQEYILLFGQCSTAENKLAPAMSPAQPVSSTPEDKPLEQLEKLAAFGRLSGGVLHDFNNLLTIINGYCELLSLSLKPDDPANTYVEQIFKTCTRGASLAKQLLGFSRHRPIKHSIFDINELVTNMVALLQRILRENIQLISQLTPEPAFIKADAAEIEQIIINLVVNARDAMPHGGKLLIETKKFSSKTEMTTLFGPIPAGDYITLSIQDNGIGMNEKVQQKLFTPFFTTKPHGTGLGLATVLNYVKRCNGAIIVQSEEHKGSLFKIYFPEAVPPIDFNGSKEIVEILPRGSETILLVEDDQEVRRIIVRLLQMQGYNVLDAQHGDDAQLLCEKFPKAIDLLITDLMLPDLTGSELAARLKKVRPTMKVLFISGYGNAAELLAKDPNATLQEALLEKPFTVDELARKVRKLLDTD